MGKVTITTCCPELRRKLAALSEEQRAAMSKALQDTADAMLKDARASLGHSSAVYNLTKHLDRP